MNNSRFCYSAVAAVLLLVSHFSAHGQPSINVGNHTLLPNTPGQTIPISVSGGTLVQGLNFNVQIADGFPTGGTVDGPNIADVDVLGTALNPTIFFGNNTGQQDIRTDPQVWSASTTTAAGTVSASGLLGIVTVDTTGWFGGTWGLFLGSTQEGPTDFALINATITDGSITVVPEPASTFLFGSLLFGGALVLRRFRRA